MRKWYVIHEFSVYGGYTTTVYLKRNMAGGEKKRVSEMMRERLRRMEERMHGPVDQEQVTVYEEEVEPEAVTETTPPAESQETGEEDVPVLNGTPEQFVETQRALIGTPYVWGGKNLANDGGLDCSGAILYGVNQLGNDIPVQNANSIYHNLTVPVERGDFKSGDLRFMDYDDDGDFDHVQVIVAEDGSRVNATGTKINTKENPGIIELLSGPLPQTGEIRRLDFRGDRE